MIPFLIVQQIIAGAALSGTRAALALFAIGLSGRLDLLALPGELVFLSSNVGLAVLVGLAAAEEFLERDEDLQELVELAHYGVRGSGGATVAWCFEQAGATNAPEWLAPLLGAVVAAGTHDVRMRIFVMLRGFGESLLNPRQWLLWLELGGVFGLLVALILAPVIAASFVLFGAVMALMGIGARWWFERLRRRRECPGCRSRVRQEASLCRSCGTVLDVVRWRT